MRVFEPLTEDQHPHPSTASYAKAFVLLESSDVSFFGYVRGSRRQLS